MKRVLQEIDYVDKLRDAMHELHDMNPPPMNTMLEKQSREEAIQKRTERKRKTVQDVPPMTPDYFKGPVYSQAQLCLPYPIMNRKLG